MVGLGIEILQGDFVFEICSDLQALNCIICTFDVHPNMNDIQIVSLNGGQLD